MRATHHIALLAFVLTTLSQAAPTFRAGASAVDITPTNYPVIVNAMFTERSASKAVDPLHVRALALDDGSNRLVMAVVDTCMMARELIGAAKLEAGRVTGLPAERMLVSATHTHSAPSAMGCLGSRADTNYAAFLVPRIAAAIVSAVSNLQPARVGWGSVEDWEHTFCRRWIRRPDRMLTDPFGDSNVRANMHPGHQSPDVVGPSGPVDPALSVLALQSIDGKPLAVLANYSQHYYGSPLLSSDYYGKFGAHLAHRLGASGGGTNGFIPIMSQGTSGDLMWMDYSAPAKDIGYDAYAKAIADNVAALVQAVEFREWVSTAMAERTLDLAYRVPDESRLAWARKVAQTLEGRLPKTQPEIYALEALYLHARPRTELKIQALRIGELGIVALPNEVYALTGLKLKEQSPLAATFVVELANGAEGYLPPPEQHKLGGYTTWPARTAGLETNAEPRIVETALSLLEQVSGARRRSPEDTHGPYAKAVLASRPLAYWRLNESVATVAHDASPHGRRAHYEDGVAVYLPGVDRRRGFQPPQPDMPNAFSGETINRSPHFAGGRLRAHVPLTAGAYSVELWFWNGLPANVREITGFLFSRENEGNAAGEHLGIAGTRSSTNSGRIIFSTGPQPDRILHGRTEITWREWNHVVLVRHDSAVAVYLNGNAAPEIAAKLTLPDLSDTLFIGGRSDGIAGFEGKIDEVAVYDRVLTADEIAGHYAAAQLRR